MIPASDRFQFRVRVQVLLPLLLLLPLQAFAKEHPDFRLGLNFQVVSAGFDLDPLSSSGDNRLSFRPAQSDYIGVIAGWRWLAGSYAFKVGASQDVRDTEGESQYRDLRLSYNLSNFGAEASYTRYVGYLISNSNTLSASTLNGQAFYKVPDLETLGYGINMFWVPSPGKFNLAAALDQSEIEDESGGAWILMATWRYQKIQSNSPWIPAEKQALFGADQTIRYAASDFAAVGGGYGVVWIPPSDLFFVSGLLALTAGYEDVSYVTDDGAQSKASIGLNGHARIVAGVNVEQWILTLSGYVDYFSSTTQSVKISPSINGGILTAVVRF